MRVELAPALILHRRAWRDTSVLVEAFAREHGRIGLLAKGARRPKSRWQGVLEPLTGLALSWTGRGELHTLTDVDAPRRYRLSGHALMGGFYACELIMRLLARDDPHPPLYDSLIALLDGLDAGAPAIVALRFFERDLLDVLGYGISLEATSDDDTAVVAGGLKPTQIVANIIAISDESSLYADAATIHSQRYRLSCEPARKRWPLQFCAMCSAMPLTLAQSSGLVRPSLISPSMPRTPA